MVGHTEDMDEDREGDPFPQEDEQNYAMITYGPYGTPTRRDTPESPRRGYSTPPPPPYQYDQYVDVDEDQHPEQPPRQPTNPRVHPSTVHDLENRFGNTIDNWGQQMHQHVQNLAQTHTEAQARITRDMSQIRQELEDFQRSQPTPDGIATWLNERIARASQELLQHFGQTFEGLKIGITDMTTKMSSIETWAHDVDERLDALNR